MWCILQCIPFKNLKNECKYKTNITSETLYQMKEPYTEAHRLYDSGYVIYSKKQNLHRQKVGCLRLGLGTGLTINKHKEILWKCSKTGLW